MVTNSSAAVRWIARSGVRAGLALLLICFLCAEPRAADLVLSGATVYPAPDAPPIADAVVVIRDGRIAAVGPRAATSFAAGSQVLDCSGNVIVAGFWNSHVHIFTPSLLRASSSDAGALSAEMDTMFNRWGFTTVFDVASVLENTLALRGRIDSGEVRGPHILTVGEPLWTETPIYVREYLKALGIDMPPVRTPAEAVRRVRAQAKAGARGIKLFTGSLQAGTVANMPLDTVRAAADEAHRRHLPVFAHPQNSEGLEVAIAGGVDILAHTAPDSQPWTPQFVRRLKRAHMALMPTLTLFDFESKKAGMPELARGQWIEKMIGELQAYSQSGGEVLFGTDIGYTDHFDTAMEFTLMSRAVMSFRQILASLTTNPARRFGYASRRGRIARGMDADLVVLRDDPAKDATAFSSVRFTIRTGTIVYESK